MWVRTLAFSLLLAAVGCEEEDLGHAIGRALDAEDAAQIQRLLAEGADANDAWARAWGC